VKTTTLVKEQVKTYGPKIYTEGGRTYRITAKVRYDDQCGNGHNGFGITADIDEKRGNGWYDYAGGCCHDEIVKHFPELAPYIKWHLMDSDGPMHYLPNVLFLAGDRDCWGLRNGEFRQHKSCGKIQNNGIAGVPNWVLELPDRESRDVYATTKPAPVTLEWKAYGRTGEGKARELEAARRVAIWPEATDEQLSAEPEVLKAALLARLPALLKEFQKAVESLGFTF
jgi:hypothetical protein